MEFVDIFVRGIQLFLLILMPILLVLNYRTMKERERILNSLVESIDQVYVNRYTSLKNEMIDLSHKVNGLPPISKYRSIMQGAEDMTLKLNILNDRLGTLERNDSMKESTLRGIFEKLKELEDIAKKARADSSKASIALGFGDKVSNV